MHTHTLPECGRTYTGCMSDDEKDASPDGREESVPAGAPFKPVDWKEFYNKKLKNKKDDIAKKLREEINAIDTDSGVKTVADAVRAAGDAVLISKNEYDESVIVVESSAREDDLPGLAVQEGTVYQLPKKVSAATR